MALFVDLRAAWPEPYLSPDDADELLEELKKAAAAEDISSATCCTVSGSA